MIVVLSYFNDGLSEPEIEFFPESSHQTLDALHYATSKAAQGKKLKIYLIHNLRVFPTPIEDFGNAR